MKKQLVVGVLVVAVLAGVVGMAAGEGRNYH